MMRIFLVRLANSVTQTVLPVPCLLVCLACATPFPLESLEVGMTTETVREKFGEPEAIISEPGGVEFSWTYFDEWQNWPIFIFPQVLLSIPICAAITDKPWDCAYVTRRPVLLHFEGEKLARWEVIENFISGFQGIPVVGDYMRGDTM
jgi:hypothetical protein